MFLSSEKTTCLWSMRKRIEIILKYLALVVARILIGVGVKKKIYKGKIYKEKIYKKKMIILNYCLPACNYDIWYYLNHYNDIQIEEPPEELHLNIDITKLNQADIDWMKINCKSQLMEIIPEIKKYNEN